MKSLKVCAVQNGKKIELKAVTADNGDEIATNDWNTAVNILRKMNSETIETEYLAYNLPITL